MDTLTDIINELNKKGYTEDFRAGENHLEGLVSKKKFNPEELLIVESHRFEGMTDPADETVCFAMEASDGTKGTLVMSYSAEHSQEIETIRKIPTKK